MESPILIGPITQAITMDKLPLKGSLKDEQLEIVKDAGILMVGGQILEIGDFARLTLKAISLHAEIIELKGKYVALPGWIDCHTHICFGGSRAKDFAMRNAGKSYLEIAQAGGGIWDTVIQTRNLTQQELAARTAIHANRHLHDGVTTIEVKSGYGLNPDEELKMLRAIQEANSMSDVDLIPTCLAAHMKPRDFKGNNGDYLHEISERLFPILKAQKLSNRIDSFIEQSAFSPGEIESYYQKATELGFELTVHADQFATGGSEVAVKFNAKSADHLEASGEKEITLLAKSDTVAVALPGASIGLGCAFAPARKILDKGGALAIASDWNPGSAPMGDLVMQASILATFEKLSTAEVFSALTFRAAAALGLADRGKLVSGSVADFNLYPTADCREILYQQGKLKPEQVWKKGKIVKGVLSK